jgi:protein-disulfide isomerase
VKLHKILSYISISSLLSVSILATSAPLDQDQTKQVQKIVHDYLVTNPEVLVEASKALQKKEAGKMEEKAQGAVAANAKALFADAGDPVLGNPKGNVTVVEFFDYQCSHCKDEGPVIEGILKNNKDVRVVLKQLPILGPGSKYASAAVLAANLQGGDKYEKLHKALLAAPNPLNEAKVSALAKASGIDMVRLEKDMKTDAIKKQLDNNFKMAEALELVGTPSFVVGKWDVDGKDNTAKGAVFVPGVLDQAGMQSLINQVRKS